MRITELPEIGTKYELESSEGDKVAIIFLSTGDIELYVLEAGAETPSVTRLTSEEARRIGGVLTGTVLTIEREDVEITLPEISDRRIDVHVYPVTEGMIGKSIADLAIRKRTGVTITAISRRGESIISPPAETVFEAGDMIVAIGEHDQMKACEGEVFGSK